SWLKRWRWEGIKQKCSAAHNLAAVDPDVEIAAHDVDVGRRVPVRAGMRAVRIAERDVNAGDFLVLENVADYVVNGDVGADGEFAHAVAVLIGVAVAPELGFEFLVGAVGFRQAAFDHLDGQRSSVQIAVLFAQVIAHHAIDDEAAIHPFRGGEGFAAGQIAPLVGADDAAGFDPLEVRRKPADDVGGGRLPDQGADGVHLVEIGEHALQDDPPVDIHHVGVAHLAPVDDVGHLHASAQFVGLGPDGEDADVAGFHIGEDFAGHVLQGARRQVFQNKGVEVQVAPVQFRAERRANLEAGAVGDQGHFLAGLYAEAVLDGVARTREEGRVERRFAQQGVHWRHGFSPSGTSGGKRPYSVSSIM